MENTKAQVYADALLKRHAIRTSMKAWAGHCFPDYKIVLHQELLCSYLEKCARREIRKLAIFMPPGSAKSTYSSKLFPSFFLAQDPKQTILLCSHSKDLAQNFGRASRNLIEQNPNELGYSLAKDSQAADEWATDKGGSFFCAGVGGRISGRRADLALIDDPIGSREDADSKLVRDSQWNWYLTDFKPRLKPNATIVLIQTRFHEDDLAGRILKHEKDWTVIRLPMLAEDNDPLGRQPGELLWPEWFTPEMALEAQRDERVWSSLYQQRPTPESGNFFKSEWLRTYESYDDIPKNLRIYVGSDHAVSLKQEADFTCLLPVGIDTDDNLWVLPDIFWSKCDTLRAVNEMMELGKRRKPLLWFSESAHIEKSIGPFLRKRMQELSLYFAMQELSSASDKRIKAQALQGRMAQGKVFFPAFASWWDKAKHDLMVFDAGEHDDFIDALANVCRGLAYLIRPEGVQKPKEQPSLLSVKWLKNSFKEQQREKELSDYLR